MKTTIAFLLLFSNLYAAPLTLNDAIAMTLKSNPQTQAALLRIQSSQADTKAAKAALYAHIDLNGEYYPTKTVVMPSNGTFSTRQTDAFHADVSGSYSLWDFGRNDTMIQASQHSQEGSVADKKFVENSLIEQVWLQYTAIAYVEQLIDTAQKSAEFCQSQYNQAVRMREVGLKTQADESRFKASWLEANDHHSAAQAQKAKALMALGLLIGSDTPVTIDQADFDRRVSALSMVLENVPALRQELSQSNPQLQKLRMLISRDQAVSSAISKQPYGSVTLVGAYGYDNSLSSYDTSQIGVRASIPLYDGGKLDADAQKSRITLTLAQKEYEITERELWQELYDTIIDLNRFDETIAAKEGVMSATQKALSLMQGRYAQGLATYIDILESQSVLENARIVHADAKLQKIRSWVKIQRLLNKGNKNGML
ncbi:MAG: TolC family protein [Sulfuricurvum sp.]|nr:TolC family protein [Sulfuricurvum sp.]